MERVLVVLFLALLLASAWCVDGRQPESRGLLLASPESEDSSHLGETPWAGDRSAGKAFLPGDVSAREGGTRSWESERPLVEEAQAVLVGYRQRGDCVLAHAGYVDLMGGAWSCVIQGDGWVDVCVVQETNEGRSRVSVSRIENATWEEDLHAEGSHG